MTGVARAAGARRVAASRIPPGSRALATWLRGNEINLARHARGLRPFRPDEFGTGPSCPSGAHMRATNAVIALQQRQLRASALRLSALGERARRAGDAGAIDAFLVMKERGNRELQVADRTWDFFYWVFSQRVGPMGRLLHGADRIALDCYRVMYTTIGRGRPIPSPAPFTYMEAGLGPATWRRGIPLPRAGRIRSPYPLIELPYSRLMNPWTLAAIAHEAAHNLQQDLDLVKPVDARIAERGARAGVPPAVLALWRRWNRELFADLLAILMVGPAALVSLSEVVAKSGMSANVFRDRDAHPVPVLRVLVGVELVQRLGFVSLASRFRAVWLRAYPLGSWGSLPTDLVRSFDSARPAVVAAICEDAYEGLGGLSLRQMLPFGPREQRMIEEAAVRLAEGVDPGIVPERFLIAAARRALERGAAPAATLFRNFYIALDRR